MTQLTDTIARFQRWLKEDEDSRYYGGPTIPPEPLTRDDIAQALSLLESHFRRE